MFKSAAGALLFLLPVPGSAAIGLPVPAGIGLAGLPREPINMEIGLDSVPADTVQEHPGIWQELNNPVYNRMLDKAIRYQEKADSLGRLAVAWRKEAADMIDPVLRGRLQGRIEKLEDSAGIFWMLADEHFNYLSAGLPLEPGAARRHPYLVKDTVLNGITVYRYKLTDEFMARLDTIRGKALKTSHASAGYRLRDIPREQAGNQIEKDFKIPPGVFYRIQLAVYSKEVEPGHFGGLAPIMAETIPGKDLTRYYVGKYTRMEDARSALNRIRALGYRDAFIIGYYNGKKSSFSKLRALEE